MEHYDLIVIGGGPSGYAGAMRALDFKKKVLLIEKKRIGGAGVYDGVLTSKTLWELSQKVSSIREMIPNYHVDYQEMVKIVNEAVFERKTQMTVHLNLLQKQQPDRFCYEKGTASFLDKNTIAIKKEDGSTKTVSADNILIATGSRPRYLPHIAIDEKIIMTSDGVKNLAELPKSLVVLGAGVIGCEFATIFSSVLKEESLIICS
ncbi:MAG: FAD-dependent oxidoreductase, partial [Bacteroidota bacterium]